MRSFPREPATPKVFGAILRKTKRQQRCEADSKERGPENTDSESGARRSAAKSVGWAQSETVLVAELGNNPLR